MWDQLIGAGLMVLAFKTLPFDKHALYPWDKVGSYATLTIISEAHSPLDVWARAPEVDSATRYMGTVPPCDSTTLRVPYGDTEVTFYIGDQSFKFNVNKPYSLRIVARERTL